ncbi:MAG: alanine--glyoxylate aminotransferase family protein [Polyangiaceae bacterium]
MSTRRLLMIPGPIELEPDVLSTMAEKQLSHVDPDFIETFGRTLGRVREVFLAPKSQPFVISGSGTLAMEVALHAILEPNDKVLVVDTGWFSERMANMVSRVGAEATRVRAQPGSTPDLAEVERLLSSGGFRAVTITHVDTSTGVRAPVREVAALANRYGVLSVVDGVCSVGGEQLETGDWGVDIALTASQKALGAPPGLAVLVFSERALERYRGRKSRVPSLYLDIGEWLPIMQAYESRKPAYFATPAVNLVSALDTSLAKLVAEGMAQRVARHRKMASAFHAAFSALGLTLLAQPEVASSTISAVYYPEGVDASLVQAMRDEGIVMAGGLHPDLKTKYFRIGHMGSISASDALATIGALERSLIKLGAKIDAGAGVAAAQRIVLG